MRKKAHTVYLFSQRKRGPFKLVSKVKPLVKLVACTSHNQEMRISICCKGNSASADFGYLRKLVGNPEGSGCVSEISGNSWKLS